VSAQRALVIFRAVFVAFIVFVSTRALLAASTIAYGAHAQPAHIIALATIEIAAALALLWAGTEQIAAGVLVFVFAVGAVLDTRAGDVPVRYAYYAATALFIAFLRRRLAEAV